VWAHLDGLAALTEALSFAWEETMSGVMLRAALAAFLALVGSAQAQDWPQRPVTLIIPFAAGGPQDTIGRVVVPRMSEVLGQQIVIENVGGAGGTTGGRKVATAAPDGYTFLQGSVGTQAQSQTLYKKPPYNSVTDFTPVGLLGETPIALTVRKDLPAKDFKEFVAYTKANQAKMSFGSAGTGSATHLGCVMLNLVLGTDVTHVPYRGTGPAMLDLQGGRLDFMCEIINTAKPHIEAGAIRALAIMTKERSPVLPNLPTALEQGTPGLEAYTWTAFFLPKGVPDAIVKKLNNAMVQALKTPAVRDRLAATGVQVVSEDRMTPQYLGGFVKSEIEKWAAPIKKSGAQQE
jgi:tripartite-type tricarboxylate transporter receptor subunit TctC